MSENIGTLEAELVLSNKQLNTGAKKSEAVLNKLGREMDILRQHGEKLNKQMSATPQQAKNLKAINEAYMTQKRSLKLVGDQQATFNDLIKAGVSSGQAYKIALGQESTQHKELVASIQKERNAVNLLKKAKQDEQNVKVAAAQKTQEVEKIATEKIQKKTEVDANIRKNIVAQREFQQAAGLSAKKQKTYNAMVRAGIPHSDAMAMATNKLSRDYQKQGNAIKKLTTRQSKLNRANTSSIVKNAKIQRSSMDNVASSMGFMTNPYMIAAAGIAAVTYASIKLGKAVVSTNATIENAGVKWDVLLGGMDAAKTRMDELKTFAAKTPFKFEGISRASTILQSFGGDNLATGKSLEKLGDMSALAQRPIEELAMHYGRMYDAIQNGRPFGESALRMQELGLMSGKTSNQLNRMSKEGKKGSEMWDVFLKSTAHADGLMGKLSQTWDGLASTLVDNLTIILQESSKPLFDEMKGDLEDLLNYVVANKDTITSWLNDWFNGVAKIVDVTGEMIGSLGKATMAIAEFTKTDTPLEALNKQGMAFARTIVDIDNQIKEATKSQLAYGKTGDSSMVKQIGLSITALKSQREEQIKNINSIKFQVKNIKNLTAAELGLKEANAAKRKQSELNKKTAEQEAEKVRLLAEANKKVANSILQTIISYENKSRALKLVGEQQTLFNDLVSSGITGEQAFKAVTEGSSTANMKNVATLQKVINSYNGLNKIVKEAKAAGEAKMEVTSNFDESVRGLRDQKTEMLLTGKALEQFNALTKAGLSSDLARKQVAGELGSEYSRQTQEIVNLVNEMAKLEANKIAMSEADKKRMEDLKALEEERLQFVKDLYGAALDNIGETMANIITEGKADWDAMFKSIFSDITKLLIKTGETKLINSLAGATMTATGGEGLSAFANGGVVNSPTMFPMSTGTGLMGEAGSEAIMPLTRINGKLGVASSGENSGNKIVNINVTSPDGNLSKPTINQLSSEAKMFLGM